MQPPAVGQVCFPSSGQRESVPRLSSEGDTGINIRWVCGLELTSQVNDADWYWKAQLWGSQEWVCSSPFIWNCSPLLGASSVLRKVRNVRADFESYSEQLTMKTGLLFILLLKLLVQRARKSTVVSCQPPLLVSQLQIKVKKNTSNFSLSEFGKPLLRMKIRNKGRSLSLQIFSEAPDPKRGLY